MGQARIRKINAAYPKGSMTSPHGNTSDDAATTAVIAASLNITESALLQEIPDHITDVMMKIETDFEPHVFVVEIEDATIKVDAFDSARIRTLSDGSRIFINPFVTDEFILRHTTQDILTITKLLAQEGKVALLVFREKRYGILSLGKFKLNQTGVVN